MPTCTVSWRPSGGRGEFEFVPADSLEDREIKVLFEPLGVTIPAEVRGVRAQGKPRLRKFVANDRAKFHLPQLVMAVARLPEPAREDLVHAVQFPLENKSYVMQGMDFDIVEDDGIEVLLAPLRVRILHSTVQIDLPDKLEAIATDWANIENIRTSHPDLAASIEAHRHVVLQSVNTVRIRALADVIVGVQTAIFGATNVGSATVLEAAAAMPEVEAEAEITGKEGRLLTRIHVYRERDVKFAKMAKAHFRKANGGHLTCIACQMDPIDKYGANGERCIEAHHTIPIEELQPDSVTQVRDMAMVCASCHRLIHSQKPCLTIEQMKTLLGTAS